MNRNQPSKLKYVGAWLLANIVTNALHQILTVLLAEIMVKDISDLNFYLLVTSALLIPIMVGSFMLVYRLFSSLSVKRVMPYLYVLSPLGALLNISMEANDLEELGVFGIYSGGLLIALVASLYLIRSYYIKKPERWF